MKVLFTTILALFAVAANAQFSNQTIDVNGTSRQYRQYLPSNLSNSEHVPLVIALHGIGDDMQNFSGVGFSWFCDTARFICVFPQGIANSFGQNSWNNGTMFLSSTADDIGMINKIIDHMSASYDIDLSRVYVCGFSMGGIMAYHTACALPHRIAAAASVAGTMSDVDVAACNPGRAIPIMHMHGTADGTIPYNGQALPSLSLVPTTINFWKNNNNTTDSTVTALPNTVPGDNITVDKIAYTNGGAELNLWKENGADHQWLYCPVNDIDATIEIWKFFLDKQHPNVAGVGINETVAPAFNAFVSGNDLTISAEKNIGLVEVYDMQGKLLVQTKAQPNSNECRIALPPQNSQLLLIKAVINGQLVSKRILPAN